MHGFIIQNSQTRKNRCNNGYLFSECPIQTVYSQSSQPGLVVFMNKFTTLLSLQRITKSFYQNNTLLRSNCREYSGNIRTTRWTTRFHVVYLRQGSCQDLSVGGGVQIKSLVKGFNLHRSRFVRMNAVQFHIRDYISAYMCTYVSDLKKYDNVLLTVKIK